MTRPAHARSNGPAGEAEAPRDDVLLEAAHAGDAEAFRALRERYHGTALAVARSRTGSAEESERLVTAAFGRIEQIVGEGGGPRAFLGAFVVWMVGREADGGMRPVALPNDPSDPASLVRVFSGLPAEWQSFLWHTEILGHSARRASAALGLGAVAAAGLHRDMVRGLRGLYGRAATDRAAGPDCAEFSGELAHFVRGTRGQRSRRDVKAHLDGCARCTAEYLSRQDIGTGLRTWTLPVLAGLPLWGTESLELANLIAAAGAGTAAAAGAGTAAAAGGTGAAGVGHGARAAAVGAGAGVAGAGVAGASAAGARPDGAAGTSPWSGRTVKVLLGAGALATAVAVAVVGVSGGKDPVPAADSLAAEQAPRTAQDLERANADDPAAEAERTDDDTAGGEDAAGGEDTGADREQGSARAEEAAAGPGPLDDPAGASQGGAQPEAAALISGDEAGTGDAGDAAAEAGGSAADTPGPSAGDGAISPGTGAERPAPVREDARAAEAGAPGAASAGGSARESSAERSPTSAPSARKADVPAREAGTSAPAPSPSSLPAVRATPAPLQAPASPTRTTAPPSDPARTGTAPGAGRQHTHQEAGAPRVRHGERGSQDRERKWNDRRSDTPQRTGGAGREHHWEQHGKPGAHGGGDERAGGARR